jgi:hypothetical protein
LYLAKGGVDFDVAFSIDDETAMAWAIILGEMDGHEFDWRNMRWKTKE